MSTCHFCKRKFKTEAARNQHTRDKHGVDMHKPPLSKEGALAVMDDMSDLPDGAFLAFAEEMGLGPEDFCE